jgi:hypothetical protein
MIFRRRELTADKIALHLEEPGAPVDVSPLQREELASSEARPKAA